MVALESARQELGSPSQPMLLCGDCAANLEALFEPPLLSPWAPENELARFPYASRYFDVVHELREVGRYPKFFIKAAVYPLV